MLRAAEKDIRFLPLKSIHNLLERASGDFGVDGENAAEEAIHGQSFDHSLEIFLEDQIKDITFVYTGDLPNGEAYEGQILRVEQVYNWSVVALNDTRISLILDLLISVQVQIQYEDRNLAFYDKEDDRWYGSEAASRDIEADIDLSVLVDIERATGQVCDGKILTNEVSIIGPSEWDY